jgi:hypothetical protein
MNHPPARRLSLAAPLLLLAAACGADDAAAPRGIDARPVEGFWILTPAVDSTKRLIFSGLQSDNNAAIAHFTTVSLLWGAAFYTGTATVTTDSLALVLGPPGSAVPVIDATYGYTVADSTLTLRSSAATEVYVRIP